MNSLKKHQVIAVVVFLLALAAFILFRGSSPRVSSSGEEGERHRKHLNSHSSGASDDLTAARPEQVKTHVRPANAKKKEYSPLDKKIVSKEDLPGDAIALAEAWDDLRPTQQETLLSVHTQTILASEDIGNWDFIEELPQVIRDEVAPAVVYKKLLGAPEEGVRLATEMKDLRLRMVVAEQVGAWMAMAFRESRAGPNDVEPLIAWLEQEPDLDVKSFLWRALRRTAEKQWSPEQGARWEQLREEHDLY